MIDADAVLALVRDANPAPDSTVFVAPPLHNHLEDIEQRSSAMQESHLKSAEPPTGSETLRRPWLRAVAVAVVVLAVGIASFVVIDRDSSPALPDVPTITHAGAACTYEGPSEFDLGAARTFSFVNETDTRASVTIFRVPDGTRIEDIDPDDPTSIFEDAQGPRSFLDFGADNTDPGTTTEFSAMPQGAVPDEAGEWLILCFVLDRLATETTEAIDRPAAIFSVVRP